MRDNRIPRRFHIRSILRWSYGLACIFVIVMYVAFLVFSRDVLEDTVRENSKFYSYLFQEVLDLQLNKDIDSLQRASRENSIRVMMKQGQWSRLNKLLKKYLPEKEVVFVRLSSKNYKKEAAYYKGKKQEFSLPKAYRLLIFGQKGHIFVAIKCPIKNGNHEVLGYLEAVYRFPPSSTIEKFSIKNDLGIIFVLQDGSMEYSAWLKGLLKSIVNHKEVKLTLKYDHFPLKEFFRFEFPLKIRGHDIKIIILKNSSLVKKDSHKFIFFLSIGFFVLLLVLAFVAIIIQTTVIKPVFSLSHLSESIRAGKEVDWNFYDSKLSTSEELNRLYQSYKHMVHSLIQAKSEAERANRLKDIFLSSVNHELRTPLTTIIGMVDLLEKTQDTEKRKQYLRILKDSSQNLLVIVNAILDFSKITSGKLDIKYSEINLRQFLEDIASVYELFAQRKDVEFVVDIDKNLPMRVKTDPVRLRQVIYNLLNNAFKFTPCGRIDFIVKVVSVEKKEGNFDRCRVLFKVKDTGIGIPSEKQDKIFKPFVQVEEVISRRFGGIGLGLSICQKIINLMGGKIEVKSEEGKGSEFFFELDFEVVEIFSEEGGKEKEIEESSSLRKNIPILLAEDDKINQELLKEMLGTIGFPQVDVVDKGTLVIEKLKERSYEIIFMDVQMPEMDGLTTTRKIREMGITTPIVALTGMAFHEFHQKCLEAGMNEFLAKPFTLQGLKKVLKKFGVL